MLPMRALPSPSAQGRASADVAHRIACVYTRACVYTACTRKQTANGLSGRGLGGRCSLVAHVHTLVRPDQQREAFPLKNLRRPADRMGMAHGRLLAEAARQGVAAHRMRLCVRARVRMRVCSACVRAGRVQHSLQGGAGAGREYSGGDVGAEDTARTAVVCTIRSA